MVCMEVQWTLSVPDGEHVGLLPLGRRGAHGEEGCDGRQRAHQERLRAHDVQLEWTEAEDVKGVS